MNRASFLHARRSRLQGSKARAGFTAVEFVIAVTAGLMVSAAAFTLAKSSVDVFQQEARVNAAQMSNLSGIDRLSIDLRRAGFGVSPQSDTDPMMCVRRPVAAQSELLTGVRVYEGSNPATTGPAASIGAATYPLQNAALAANNRFPDRIRIAGNFAGTDTFKIGLEDSTGRISLEADQLSVQRIYADGVRQGLALGQLPDVFCSRFPVGSPIRVTDLAGRVRHPIIRSCTADPNGVNNFASASLELDAGSFGGACASMVGGYVNPVAIVDYFVAPASELGNLGFPAQIAAVGVEDAALNLVTGEPSRSMLIRREIALDGTTIRREIVSDYVVDLNVMARVADVGAGDPRTAPNLVLPFDALGGVLPNRFRSLGVRLSTRARNPDQVAAPAIPPPGASLTRFDVFGGGNLNVAKRFAQVRTAFTEVHLPNMENHASW